MTGRVRLVVAVLSIVLLVANPPGSAGGVVTADSDNEAPLASAGLDQDVVVNETVLLDAGGSRDPDGEVAGYEWEIETPGGATATPSCADCAHTEFQVRRVGTYNATVIVTDDDGASRSDTARIVVEAVDPPTVELAGPTSVTAGDSYEYTATLTAGDNPLARGEWVVDGQSYDRRSVDGQTATDAVEVEFTEPGSHSVTVDGYDVFGLTAGETVTVDVSIPHGSRPCPAAVWNETSGTWDTDSCGNAPDPDGSDTGGSSSGDSGVACSEYSAAGGPQGDAEACDDDRLYWTFDGGDPLELYDGNSDGTIEYAGLEGTPEELAEQYDGVTTTVGDGVRFEDAETYRDATDGVPPDTNPNAWYNDDPSLLIEAAGEQDENLGEDSTKIDESIKDVKNLVKSLQKINPNNKNAEEKIREELGSGSNSQHDESSSETGWWNDPISNSNGDGGSDDGNGGVVDTVVDTATELISGIGGGEDDNDNSSGDGQNGGTIL